MLNLVRQYVPSLLIQTEEVILDFLRLSKAALCEWVVVDDVGNEPPLVSEN
jgi:hypothetical protein